LPARNAIDAIHEQGGIAVAAHPDASYPRSFDRAALGRLDGVEVEWPDPEERIGRAMHFYELARNVRPHISPVGSSDFHFASPVGIARTYVFAKALTEEAILDALRTGRTVARDARGNTIGDPRLVALVERHRGSERGPGDSWLVRWVGVSCAWAGLLLMTLFTPFGAPLRGD
jgi:hypothetical protein